jgi:hypothetical protein
MCYSFGNFAVIQIPENGPWICKSINNHRHGKSSVISMIN